MPLFTLFQNLVISHGRSDVNMWLNIGQILLQLVVILLFYRQGITVMVTAFSVFNILFTLLWHYAFNRTSHLRLLDAMKDTMPFALIAAAIMVATYYATLWTDVLWLLFLLRCIIAAVLYLGVMRLLHAAVLEECLQFLFKKKSV
jgi:O-antigen/teichoic acid export membrane protein